MKNINVNNLFDKLNEVKSLFQYGQKIVPILQSLVDFMQDTVPLLENINHSIADSTVKIPRATDQINNVTNATELATTEILDLVDLISNNLTNIENRLTELLKIEIEKAAVVSEMAALLGDNPEALRLMEKYNSINAVPAVLSDIVSAFPQIKNDTYNITLSLQVQDITSQQLAAVNHLISSVQSRLASLIQDIDDSQLSELDHNSLAPAGAAFDPNATYDLTDGRQDMVDAIINKENHLASQDEIDKLFN